MVALDNVSVTVLYDEEWVVTFIDRQQVFPAKLIGVTSFSRCHQSYVVRSRPIFAGYAIKVGEIESGSFVYQLGGRHGEPHVSVDRVFVIFAGHSEE